MARGLTLRIIVEQPPTDIDFALQKGSGSNYEPFQKQRSQREDLISEFQPSIKEGVSDAMAGFGGPFVHGPPRYRFVYHDIGTYAGQAESRKRSSSSAPLPSRPRAPPDRAEDVVGS